MLWSTHSVNSRWPISSPAYIMKQSSSSTDQVCRLACSTVEAASQKRASPSIISIEYRIFIGSHINAIQVHLEICMEKFKQHLLKRKEKKLRRKLWIRLDSSAKRERWLLLYNETIVHAVVASRHGYWTLEQEANERNSNDITRTECNQRGRRARYNNANAGNMWTGT
jgi:hypothetical protein